MKINESLNVHSSLLQLIGNTPLLELHKITKNLKGRYFAKLEAFNTGHSAKDRVAKYIVLSLFSVIFPEKYYFP